MSRTFYQREHDPKANNWKSTWFENQDGPLEPSECIEKGRFGKGLPSFYFSAAQLLL